MKPYSLTITSHFILTLFFSLSLFISTNLVGSIYHKEKFFNLFLPEGVPIPIVPILIVIEVVSYIARVFSLSIRLFANMMSGHILLKILTSFVWLILSNNWLHGFWLFFPMCIILIVIGLEFSIAFLQAYVYTVLVSIYLSDVIDMH